MPKTSKTPATVLISLMDEYQLNPFSLSKALKLSPSTARLLVTGRSKITAPAALRLAKLFGQKPSYWLDLQKEADLSEAAKDKKLMAAIKNISKAQKPKKSAKPPAKKKAKTLAKKKTPAKPLKKTTLRDKRKAASKVPGKRAAKTASRRAAKK